MSKIFWKMYADILRLLNNVIMGFYNNVILSLSKDMPLKKCSWFNKLTVTINKSLKINFHQWSYQIFFSIITISLLITCQQPTADNPKATATKTLEKTYKGNLNIGADLALANITRQQIEIFEHIHDSVSVEAIFEDESKIIQQFKDRKIEVMLLSRNLTEAEKNYLIDKDTIHAREIIVAQDAVAVIGHASFDDKQLTLQQLQQYFKDSRSGYKMVFNKNNTGLVKYVLSQMNSDDQNKNLYGLENDEAVFNYVADNKNTIGFVAYAPIADVDDEKMQAMVSKVKILNLRIKNEKGEWVKSAANQNDIAEGYYPFTRNIYAIAPFSYSDNLDWLFMNFLFKEKGAKIFLKAGLMPAKMPERHINVNTEPINTEK